MIAPTSSASLWPAYDTPDDVELIEQTPLDARGLPASTYAVLTRAAEQWPERTALRVMPDATRWQQTTDRTYAQLLDAVDRHAAALRAAGVGGRDAVTLLAPNCVEVIEVFFAAQRAGVAAPINPAMNADHVAELIGRSGSRVLVAAGPDLDPAVFSGLPDIVAATGIDTVFLLRPTGADTDPEVPALGDVTVAYLDAAELPRVAVEEDRGADDLAALFHTGGTTGVPKLAGHSHRNEVSNAWMIAANTVLDEDSVVFAALPLFHVNALIVTVLAPMLRGQTVVWAGPLGYRDLALYGVFWQLVRAHEISAMSAVPTVYSVLAQCPSTPTSPVCGRVWSARPCCRPRCVRGSSPIRESPCSRVTDSRRRPAPAFAVSSTASPPVRSGNACPISRSAPSTSTGRNYPPAPSGGSSCQAPPCSPATSAAAATTGSISMTAGLFATGGWTPVTWDPWMIAVS